MKNRLMLIVLAAFLWSGCACAKNSAKMAPQEKQESSSKADSTPSHETNKAVSSEKSAEEQAVQPVNPCPGKRMEYKGKVTLKGEVGSTKGAQLMLKGVILRVENRREAQQWVGKSVSATGDLCIYTCGPMEQCLMSGTIPSLKNLTLTEIPPKTP